MECFGKTISCLLRGKTGVAYALVEAVCRVYFPSSSLVDFIHFLELEMAVTLYVLKRAEEEAFIQFYGIPTKQLRCNQVGSVCVRMCVRVCVFVFRHACFVVCYTNIHHLTQSNKY